MTEWEPATETEAAMRDALRAGDQELYFRVLARTDLLLPVSAEALAGRAPMGWGTWTTGGRTHVLAFTSNSALHACLAENAGSTRGAAYSELASGWPNPEWWLAVNPGLPIEGYLPAWFVSQLSRGDVRLPGRSIGARARLEQVERAARARATAAVPRRPPPGGARPDPEPSREPAESFPRAEPATSFPSREPAASFPRAEPSREPATSFSRAEPSREPAAPFSRAEPPSAPAAPFRPAEPFREPVASFSSAADQTPFPSAAEPPSFSSPAESRPFSAPAAPGPFPSAAGPPSFSSPGEPVEFSAHGEPVGSVGPPATVPVIAPIPDRGDRGSDFGSQISADTSASWMTPAGTGRFGPPRAANGSPTAPVEASADPAPRSDPPQAWYGQGGPSTDHQATAPITRPSAPGAAENRSPVDGLSQAPAPEVRAPEPWTPTAPRSEASLFTPVSRQPVGESWSGGPAEAAPSVYEPATASVYEPATASRMSADPAGAQAVSTEPVFTSSVSTEPVFSGPVSTEPVFGSPGRTEPGSVEVAPDPVAPEPLTAQLGSADPALSRRLPSDFVPANDVEQSLLDAAGDGSTDTFLSTLLLAKVLLPVTARSSPGTRPGDDGFEWRTEALDGETYVVVFTSPERLGDHVPHPVETVAVKFAQLIRRWPDDAWSFAVNPGTPVGAKLPGGQIVALANWAAEVGLGDDTDAGEQVSPAPTEEEAPRSTYAPAREDPGRPTMMQKTIAPSQLSYYLDRGYDRVSGFVHRASEVSHLRTPAKFHAALGLGYPGSPFARDAGEIYVLRWPAHRPSLYRIPYGGQSEAAMRAMEGWVIERPPFRGNGFAPGESSDVVAEFKVDSVRLPHGAALWRIGVDGTERLIATLDYDVPVWRRAEED